MLNLTTTAPIRQIELCNDHSCHDDRPSFQIGMPSIHGHRIDNDKRTISVPRMIVIDQKTNVARTRDGPDIATTDTDQKMITIGMTTIRTISVIPIEAHDRRVITENPRTIVDVNLLAPNLEGLFTTPSRGKTCPAHGLTPRLQESQLTAHTIPLKASKA